MLKVLSLFSGIGAFEKALENLGIKYELVGFSEIDKYASASYCAIHGVDASKNLGDITKIDESKLPKDIDLITYGFPCQDISLAGRQKGLFNEDGTQTRSGLFFDALRIIEATKPKFAIAENVKNLTGKKFKEQFNLVLQSLENAGYVNHWKVLNAKDFGIPQNRERVFIISIRSDVDQGYEFPIGQELTLRLKDMLEEKVDEKYYLSDVALKGLENTNFNCSTLQARTEKDGVMPTLCARDYKDPKLVVESTIQTVIVPQKVKVRKHDVDIEKLKTVLRQHKNYSNKELASILGKPVTLVEHWFRNDKYFAIPDADIWLRLKALLKINTDEFDLPIMEFEEREGVFEKTNRCYCDKGIAPTLTSTSADEKIIESSDEPLLTEQS